MTSCYVTSAIARARANAVALSGNQVATSPAPRGPRQCGAESVFIVADHPNVQQLQTAVAALEREREREQMIFIHHSSGFSESSWLWVAADYSNLLLVVASFVLLEANTLEKSITMGRSSSNWIKCLRVDVHSIHTLFICLAGTGEGSRNCSRSWTVKNEIEMFRVKNQIRLRHVDEFVFGHGHGERPSECPVASTGGFLFPRSRAFGKACS